MASTARSFFDQHDDDGDGRIDVDELTLVLTDLGLKRPGESDRDFSALVARAMREHDANADGTLSFNEFRSMYATITGVDVEDRREAASGSVLDARGLPSDTFTAGVPNRDGATGGITSPIEHDFAFTDVLGTGGFAVVKKAMHLRTKQLYAVKIVNVAHGGNSVSAALDDDAMTIGEVAEEIRLTMSVSAATRANAVKVYDFYVAFPRFGGTRAARNGKAAPTHVYVVMELLRGGDLLEAITKEGAFRERDAAVVMHRLFTGLETMHAKNMAHRDLKLENLIFAEKGRVVDRVARVVDKNLVKLETLRIADFGLAKKMKTARARLTSQCGTPAYIAPEVLNGETYTPAVDMWAAGVILYATLCGELPFDHRDLKSSFKLIVAGKYHAPNVRLSAECADLLNRLLCVNKVKRLTASEALQHPFLGSLRERNRRRSDDEDLRDVSAESPWTNDAKFAATENESVKSHGSSRRRGDASDQNSVSDAPSLRSFHALLAKQESSPGARLARAADSRFGTDLETRRVLKGELLIREGDVAEEVFLIKKGRVAVEVRVDGKTVVVATRGEGEFVGEMGADVGAEAKKDIADEGDFGYNPNAKREAGERAEENGALIKNATFDARADAIKTSPTAWVSGASASAEKLLRRGATNDDTSDEQTNASSPGRRGADVRALEDVTVAVMNAAQMRWLLDHDYGADSELTSAVANRRKELERATRTVTFSEQRAGRARVQADAARYGVAPVVNAGAFTGHLDV
jgi:protein serine kinase H